MQAPNTYPEWFAPDALVTYGMPTALITNFPARSIAVGPPDAHLRYRAVEPADYQLRQETTNWVVAGETHYSFRFHGVPPPFAEIHRGPVRGTLLLLHGYSVDGETLMPWALRLAQDGWRSVIPDLRGHGGSTGRKVFFGMVETTDLKRLLDELDRENLLAPPVVVIGASYGAAVGLKLATEDTRIAGVAALTPYAHLETAILGIRKGYADWIPESWVRGAARRLPELAGTVPGGLDPVAWVQKHPVRAWLLAGSADTIAPVGDVQELRPWLAPGSAYAETPNGIHETIPFQLDELDAGLRQWLEQFPAGLVRASPSSPALF